MIIFRDQIEKANKKDRKPPLTIRRLRRFISRKEPGLVELLGRMWARHQQVITYKEIREALMSGTLTDVLIERWQEDYSKFITSTLYPLWIESMEASVTDLSRRYPTWSFDPTTAQIRTWAEENAAKLITNINTEQRKAVNRMVSYAATTGISVDDLAVMIRPTIGLNARQAEANLRYRNAVKTRYMELNGKPGHGSYSQARIERIARESAIKYAAKQHRYRAQMIARYELASAYNQGEEEATRQAQQEGLLGHCVKRSVSAGLLDTRTCEECKRLERLGWIDFNEDFQTKFGPMSGPPYHNGCRCTKDIKETDPPVF